MSEDEIITARWATGTVSDGVMVHGLPGGRTMRITGPQMPTVIYRIGIMLLGRLPPDERKRLEQIRDAVQGKIDELDQVLRDDEDGLLDVGGLK